MKLEWRKVKTNHIDVDQVVKAYHCRIVFVTTLLRILALAAPNPYCRMDVGCCVHFSLNRVLIMDTR